jgi:putative ABC transport system permease protein
LSSGPDPSIRRWRDQIRRRAAADGIELPASIVDELALHLDDIYTAARAEGASDADAGQASQRALERSALDLLREHAARNERRLQQTQADIAARAAARRGSLGMLSALRMAIRQFQFRPGFALITIAVLGLTTGAATTVFTVVDAVVLRPLPYDEPDRLATIWDTNVAQAQSQDPISPVNFMDQRSLPVFADAAAWWRPGVNLTDPGLDPVRVKTIEVSGNLFDVLGITPQVGAGFPAGGPLFVTNELIAVISDRLWRTRYAADPSIIGRQLSFNDTPYTIVGVMPPRFHYPDNVDVWQRLRWDMTRHSRQAHFMEAVARLSDGTTLAQAQSAVDALWTRIETEHANTQNSAGTGWGSRLIPLVDQQLGYYRPALIVLFGAVGLLTLIGVLNVASLLLTRALSRDREIAVRMAMGASPRQLVTQLMAESLVLSAAGAAVGVAAAAVLLPAIVAATPLDIPRLDQAGLDFRALGLAAAIVGVTTIFFGLVPAVFLLRGHASTDLKSGGRGTSRGARRTYSVLVGAEVSLACALLVCSALLVRTVGHMMSTPTGVDAERVLTTTIQLNQPAQQRQRQILEQWAEIGDTHSRILEQIRLQPGVTAAGASNFLPLEIGWRNPFAIDGQPLPASQEDLPQAQLHSASEGYFEAMGAKMAEGRSFTPFDGPGSAGVAVVNQSFARRYLAEGPAAGRVIRVWTSGIGPLGVNLKASREQMHAGIPFEVVGVVEDVRNVPIGQAIEPAIYFSTRQFPFSEVQVAVRASTPAAALSAVRTALRQAAPMVPMGVAQTWGERFAARTAEPRLLMTILIFFGALAAILAALGVYGLFSWSVALRQRELAIRLALGARPLGLGGLVLRQSALLVGLGLLAGFVVVRLSEAALSRVLFEVRAGDTQSTLAAGALIVVTAIAACIPPARRAMRVDPVEGLRVE